jgi:hypothetical protein
LESIGVLVQDLFHSDRTKVNAALVALFLNLDEDMKKCEKIVTVGGCHALVHLMKSCIEKATEKIPACDQVTETNQLAELQFLDKSLAVIISLTCRYDESGEAGITAIGGVEAVIKVMKTFPKCYDLQSSACAALLNLTRCNIGKSKAVESGGFEVLLAAVNNHLDSANFCEGACLALADITGGCEENTALLISCGGAAAMAKVRTKWPENDGVQTQVRKLAELIAAEVKAWADEE